MAPNHRRAERARLAGASPLSNKDEQKPPEMGEPPFWRRVLRWDQMSYWVSFVPGVFGAGLMTVGEVGLGEVLFGLALVIFVGSVLTWNKSFIAKAWIILVATFVTGAFVLQIDFNRVKAAADADADAMRKPYGRLTPGTESYSGNDDCMAGANLKYAIHVGETTLQFADLPHTAVSLHGKSILGAEEDKDKSLAISLSIFDVKGNVLATIEKNQYYVSPVVFRKYQNDWHGFDLYDMRNTKIVSVRLLNKKEFSVSGSLVVGDGIGLHEDNLILPGNNTITGGCLSGTGVNISIN